MEEDCGGGQGLSWAVEPRKERNLKGRDHLGDLGIHGNIILKWML
jgi:hypothetical protein